MDLAAYFVGISAIVIAVFLATGLQLWQVIRSDARIDRIEAKLESEIKHQGETLRSETKEQGKTLRAEINHQGKTLRAEINHQGKTLRAEMKEQGETLRAEMREWGTGLEAQMQELRAEVRLAGQRVSDAELEQARLNGVNSVLTAQSHTHESAAD